MNHTGRHLTIAAIVAISILGTMLVRADDDGTHGQRNAYAVTSLVSNLTGAAVQDKILQNAWGVAFTSRRQSLLGQRQRHGLRDAL